MSAITWVYFLETKDVDWMDIKLSDEIQDDFSTFYVHSIYTLCPEGKDTRGN